MHKFQMMLIVFVTLGFFATSASADSRLHCTVTSPMKDQVGQGGYGFSTYSNLATLGSEMCLQHILRNLEGNTAAKVEWYEPRRTGRTTIIGVRTLPGCYDSLPNQECNCTDIPCQVAREFYSENFGIRPILSTADFGITAGQYSDRSIKARNVDIVGFQETDGSNGEPPSISPSNDGQDSNLEGTDQIDTRYALAIEGENELPPMTTRLSGYPAGSGGEVISLDIYIRSAAFRVENEFIIENSINTEAGFNAFVIAPLSDVKSGEVNLEDGRAAVSWSGFEPEEFESVSFPQDQLLSLSEGGFHKYVANNVGVEPNAEIVIFMNGEIVLVAQAPVYTGLE
ncbi:MAG: hypothetical protein AAF718_03585 [Pseudomonadota bacterium]